MECKWCARPSNICWRHVFDCACICWCLGPCKCHPSSLFCGTAWLNIWDPGSCWNEGFRGKSAQGERVRTIWLWSPLSILSDVKAAGLERKVVERRRSFFTQVRPWLLFVQSYQNWISRNSRLSPGELSNLLNVWSSKPPNWTNNWICWILVICI